MCSKVWLCTSGSRQVALNSLNFVAPLDTLHPSIPIVQQRLQAFEPDTVSGTGQQTYPCSIINTRNHREVPFHPRLGIAAIQLSCLGQLCACACLHCNSVAPCHSQLSSRLLLLGRYLAAASLHIATWQGPQVQTIPEHSTSCAQHRPKVHKVRGRSKSANSCAFVGRTTMTFCFTDVMMHHSGRKSYPSR